MGSLTRAYATDPKKESEGVLIDVAINDDKSIAQMKIRRMGQSNKEFTKRFATLSKKFKMLKGNKAELENKALREAFVETCLIGWQNIENINEALPGTVKEEYMGFSQENALKLFTALPELFDFVVGQAIDLETFQSAANEEIAKNSFPSSTTT